MGSAVPTAQELIPGEAEFVRNAWYVAAYSREVEPGALLARTICERPLVLYRMPDGSPAALYDQCPHRGLPLSKGRLLKNGALSCGYHGFQFGGNGKCLSIPSQAHVPDAMRVRSYPVVEKWKWIWVWPGDPAKADPKLIPDHHGALKFLTPGWKGFDLYYYHVNCNYLLALENLLDLQHVYFVHGPDAAEAERLDELAREFRNQVTVTQQGGFVRQVNEFGAGGRWAVDDHVKVLSEETRYRRIYSEAFWPAISRVEIQFSPHADLSDAACISTCVAVTPVSRNTCHYFSAYAINTDSSRLADAEVMKWNDLIYRQDIDVFEAIQQSIDGKGMRGCPNISVRADETTMRGRRVLEKMILAERSGS